MKYETPYIEIIGFEDADIVTASGLTVESTGDGDWKDFRRFFGLILPYFMVYNFLLMLCVGVRLHFLFILGCST